jgi:hypothetical protein
VNPCDRYTERTAWLRWQISDELATSIAPGLREGSEGARRVLVEWLTHDRERLISHCYGAMSACARHAGIEQFTRAEIAHEIELVAWCHKVGR